MGLGWAVPRTGQSQPGQTERYLDVTVSKVVLVFISDSFGTVPNVELLCFNTVVAQTLVLTDTGTLICLLQYSRSTEGKKHCGGEIAVLTSYTRGRQGQR